DTCPKLGMSVALCGAMMAFTGVLATLLWARRDWCGPYLRMIEIALFGGMAAFFSVLQFGSFHNGYILQVVNPEQKDLLLRIAAIVFSVRWFSILVLYGAFIPNTWRRCALVVGVIAAIPIVINSAAVLMEKDLRPYGAELVLDTVIIMAVGSAIAIFGSYKINT